MTNFKKGFGFNANSRSYEKKVEFSALANISFSLGDEIAAFKISDVTDGIESGVLLDVLLRYYQKDTDKDIDFTVLLYSGKPIPGPSTGISYDVSTKHGGNHDLVHFPFWFDDFKTSESTTKKYENNYGDPTAGVERTQMLKSLEPRPAAFNPASGDEIWAIVITNTAFTAASTDYFSLNLSISF